MTPSQTRSPWAWIPTLYFAQGIPYFIVNNISVMMFTKMGVPNGEMALFTSLLYLPWTIKPFWSPFVDIVKTKRWWVITMQIVMTVAFALLTLTLPHPEAEAITAGQTPISLFYVTLLLFTLTAFASATHDIAADGFYMLALNTRQQAAFVGIRSTFYRLASIFGQGVLVAIAGGIELQTGNIPLSWQMTLLITAVIFAGVTLYHTFFIPKPQSDHSSLVKEKDKEEKNKKEEDKEEKEKKNKNKDKKENKEKNKEENKKENKKEKDKEEVPSAIEILREFGRTFTTFFTKRGVWLAITFLLLYRLPEAFLLKMCMPFLVGSKASGGLAMGTAEVGIAYGTIGVIALTIGGILGGLYASRVGLKHALWWMALALTLPCSVFVVLAIIQPDNLWLISGAIALDQFGYGFGFTAYMLYMIHFSDGEFKTSHYALCTAFMALSMMIPGMVAGYLQEALGYVNFFWMVMVCCLATVMVTLTVSRRLK